MADRKAVTGRAGRRESTYDLILSALIFGDLAPGSAVDEKRIAREFGVGLAGVRDALYRLSLEGLVERQPRIGTRIPDLGLREMQDVFEARVLIEGDCAALTAERASPEELAVMRGAFTEYVEVIRQRDFRRLVRMDQLFHRTMAAACRNKLIEKQVTMLHNNASRFWYFGLPRLEPAVLRADIEMHLKVVDAMRRRDAAAAKAAMSEVLGQFPDNLRVFLKGPISLTEVRTNVRSKIDRRQRKRSQKGARTAAGVS
jgi:GntR family transcriptional regulator, rspAB operon transcriptional repressor